MNPLLERDFLIPFRRIRTEHVVPGIRRALDDARAEMEKVAASADGPSWDGTLGRLEDLVVHVRRTTTPVTHLLAVSETPELRAAYGEILPEISSFWTRLPLHEGLWKAVRAYAASEAAAGLDPVRARHLEKTVREFRRHGAELDPAPKARLEEMQVELARLQRRFSENVLDATNAGAILVADRSRLEGVPEAWVRRARSRAGEEGSDGWLVTLDFPSYEAVLKHARDRSLRREVHEAYVERCREGEYENVSLVERILTLRQETATLLGHRHYPDYGLEDAMAGSGARALAFVTELRERTDPYWRRDREELESHRREIGLDELEPWDVRFVSEDLRKRRYDIDDELLRPYFPLDRVLDGLFEVSRRVFGVVVSEREVEDVWHPDVRFYDVHDANAGTHLGSFYTDWFPRKEKRQGAWMNGFVTGGPRPDGFQPHLAFIGGNFTPPDGDRPALLTHREVETTFHEFGHLLHHCTSRVAIPSRAGTHVSRDWVELPSQIMENWTWEREALDLFARHHETEEPLPDDLWERMVRARRFLGGWSQMVQLGYAYMDLSLHLDYALEPTGDIMRWVEERIAPYMPGPAFARRHNLTTFSHLFSSGYASAYYSYLWSEVLDADAFTRFREAGIFDRETGRRYRETILETGDSEEPDVLFRTFMGRDPDPTALLERNLGALEEVAT